MSEYQFFDFLAVDRVLTHAQMAELRALSRRAAISVNRMEVSYSYGDLPEDAGNLVRRYFDAHVYVSNWGLRQLILKLPTSSLDQETSTRYQVPGCLSFQAANDAVLVDFVASNEEEAEWVEDDEARAWMPDLVPIREELAAGDLRALYLGWLNGVQIGEIEDDEVEPPLPPGLGDLSMAQRILAQFLWVDEHLIAAAAEGSPPLLAPVASTEFDSWLATLSAAELHGFLLRAVQGEANEVRAELQRRHQQASMRLIAIPPARPGTRTCGMLRVAAEARASAAHPRELARQAEEQARREQEAAAARGQYLESLAGREAELWQQIDHRVVMKTPPDYPGAVQVLRDLHDLSWRQGHPEEFQVRLSELRRQYGRRPRFMEQIDAAGLTP